MSQWRGDKVRKLQTTKKSFRFILGKVIQRLPDYITSKDPKKNKTEIKKWIRANVPWDERWEALENSSNNQDENTDSDEE